MVTYVVEIYRLKVTSWEVSMIKVGVDEAPAHADFVWLGDSSAEDIQKPFIYS